MSNSLRPHRWQPTRLLCPWDSPGKNTGVGCHFLLQCMKLKSLSCARLLATPWTAAYQAPPSLGFSRQEYWSGVPLPSPVIHSRGSQSVVKGLGGQSHFRNNLSSHLPPPRSLTSADAEAARPVRSQQTDREAGMGIQLSAIKPDGTEICKG